MYGGQIVQFGTPRDLFERPNHTFVGYFIGSPGMNLIEVELTEGGLCFDGLHLPLPANRQERLKVFKPGSLKVGIRPEFVQLFADATDGSMACQIEHIEDLGTYKIVSLLLGSQNIKARLNEDQLVNVGPAWVSFPQKWLMIYVDEFLFEEQEL